MLQTCLMSLWEVSSLIPGADLLCHGNGRDGKLHGFMELNEDDCAKIYRMMI